MKTNVSQTSIDAYHAAVSDGHVSRQQSVILASMTSGVKYTRSELAALTSLSINLVTGRVNELLKSDKLVEEGSRKCSVTGYSAKVVMLAEADGA